MKLITLHIIIFQFCKSCNKQELNLSIIKYVFCSSETITDEQYYFINKVIGIKIFNLYGHSEKLVMATNIKGVKGLVTEPTYGFTELIIKNEEGKENNIGEIVGSTYYNRFMPLIRYKTGDYAGYIYNENNEFAGFVPKRYVRGCDNVFEYCSLQ